MYGLAKVHKIVTDCLSSFRPILSPIGTPTYKLAKFLVSILELLTSNEYTIKDSFTFAEELQSFDSRLMMVSFDIESLFTNIPLKETIEQCVWKIHFKIGLVLIICRKTLSASYLLGLYLNHWISLIRSFMSSMMELQCSMMELQWAPH